MRKFISISGSFDDVRRHDNLIKNNPVLVQGLGLTVVIFSATTLRNAAILSTAMLLLCVGTHLVCHIVARPFPYRLRMMVYALVSAALYVPELHVLLWAFGGENGIGPLLSFLPLTVVDTMILAESEKVKWERLPERLRHSVTLGLGFALAALLAGALRELGATGTLLGVLILKQPPLPLLSTPIGGFIVMALLSALLQAFLNLYKKTLARRKKLVQ